MSLTFYLCFKCYHCFSRDLYLNGFVIGHFYENQNLAFSPNRFSLNSLKRNFRMISRNQTPMHQISSEWTIGITRNRIFRYANCRSKHSSMYQNFFSLMQGKYYSSHYTRYHSLTPIILISSQISDATDECF